MTRPNRDLAFQTLNDAHRDQKLLTGLFYINEDQPDLNELLNTVDTPLMALPEEKLRPSRESLDKLMASL